MSEQFTVLMWKKYYVCASVGLLLNKWTICTVQQQEHMQFLSSFTCHLAMLENICRLKIYLFIIIIIFFY